MRVGQRRWQAAHALVGEAGETATGREYGAKGFAIDDLGVEYRDAKRFRKLFSPLIVAEG